ncbi:MAG: GIY-YIG nuclease family protein [Treponema sp.]|nr:GIY-YIG nuclease family protein [Treponema sp.]
MNSSQGYVYILQSQNCDCIKIGGTDYPPLKRIKEINATEPYKSLGAWTLADFRQVTDWRTVEHNLHYRFRSSLNTEIKNQKELFHLSVANASKALNELNPEEIVYKPKIDRMFQDEAFLSYIVQLFKFTGLVHWIEQQGIWTFVLFPSTNGGRYFTLNIGSHEVAFSTLGKKDSPQLNMLMLDSLILDFPNVKKWLDNHNGTIYTETYATALSHSVSVHFEGSFSDALELFSLDGVRRALIAYWYEALIKKTEEDKLSSYERYHNYNAVAKIMERIEDKKNQS